MFMSISLLKQIIIKIHRADQHEIDLTSNSAIDHKGLTAWGIALVKEMNRLGMMVDLSHVSKKTMMDAIAASAAPVIFSHSSSQAIYETTRNVDDDTLKELVSIYTK